MNVPDVHHYFAGGAIHHNSGKTHYAAKYFLTDYWCWPECTTVLASSTDIRSLQLRIWGEITMLIKIAQERCSMLPGHILESRHAISTDSVDDKEIRDLRNGIICIPCLIGGRDIGLAKYCGVKNKRVRLLADEAQFMGGSFLDSVSNLNSNVDFKAAFIGNPRDPMDPLGKVAEPKDGWSNFQEPEKTIVYDTRFIDGKCVNFVGTDSPNNDYNEDPPRFPYLISKKKIDEVISFWGTDSMQYYSQCKGVMKSSILGRRVITMDLCRQNKAFDPMELWSGQRTKIYACDIAYGGVGGDRCVGGFGEFGQSIDGRQILLVRNPVIIPVSLRTGTTPEEKIAEFIHTQSIAESIPAQNIFYDSTGRGSMGAAFAKFFGNYQPVPVEFGSRPTRRPVRNDLFIFDEKSRIRRHKRCDEHYSKFVTELWYSSRYAIQAGQIRGLSEEVAQEGCMREWKTVASNKIEIEKKEETKERMGRSPDLYDWFVTLIEGARQRGFGIASSGISLTEGRSGPRRERDVIEEMNEKWERVQRSKRLAYAT